MLGRRRGRRGDGRGGSPPRARARRLQAVTSACCCPDTASSDALGEVRQAGARRRRSRQAGVSATTITNADNDAQKQKIAGRPVPRQRRQGPDRSVALDAGLGGGDREGGQGEGRSSRSTTTARSPGGVASIYVSFDGGTGRRAAGQGRRRRPEGERQVLEAPGDRRAGQGTPDGQQRDALQEGLRLDPQAALRPKGTFKKGPDQSVPDWSNQKARTISDQMLVSTSNKINASRSRQRRPRDRVVAA